MFNEPIKDNGLENRRSASELVTPQQLAKWLNLSTRSLCRMRSDGQLPPPLRLRKAVRWRASDIEDWLAAGCPRQPCHPAS